MSRPDDFDRLDNAAGHKPDRFTAFKAKAELDRQYRETYAWIAADNPEGALRLPHPDAADTDPAKGLELAKDFRVRIVTDPRIPIRMADW